jgi:hypothetical protein
VLRAAVQLLPKQVELTASLDEMSDEQLEIAGALDHRDPEYVGAVYLPELIEVLNARLTELVTRALRSTLRIAALPRLDGHESFEFFLCTINDGFALS